MYFEDDGIKSLDYNSLFRVWHLKESTIEWCANKQLTLRNRRSLKKA